MPTKTKIRNAPDTYLGLVRKFPLRVIRSKADHAVAMKVLRSLMVKSENLDAGESDYLEVLGNLIADYERPLVKKLTADVTPLDMLKHLMEARGMRSSDLGAVIGSKSAASMILSGQREMSKSQIRTLARHFHVSASLLL